MRYTTINKKLRFAEYLKKLPSAWVFEKFFEDSESPRKILSSSMAEEAAERFLNPSQLLERYRTLSTEECLHCAYIYLSGNRGIDIELDHFDGLADPLISSFLVYAAKDEQGKMRYFGFFEIEPVLQNIMAEMIADALRTEHTELAPSIVWPWHSVNDLTVTITSAMHNSLKKKRNGGLARQSALSLKKLLLDYSCSAKADTSDQILSIIIDFAVESGLLIEHELSYEANVMLFEKLVKGPINRRYNDLITYAIEYVGGFNVALMHKVLLHAKGEWLSLDLVIKPI